MTTHGAQTQPQTIHLRCKPCGRVTTYQRWGAPALYTCQECGTTTGRTEGLTAAEVAEAREREAAKKKEAPAPGAVDMCGAHELTTTNSTNVDEGRVVEAPPDPLENAADTIRVWRQRCEAAEARCAELEVDNAALTARLEGSERTYMTWREHAARLREILETLDLDDVVWRTEQDAKHAVERAKLAADLRDEVRRG